MDNREGYKSDQTIFSSSIFKILQNHWVFDVCSRHAIMELCHVGSLA